MGKVKKCRLPNPPGERKVSIPYGKGKAAERQYH